MPTRGGPQRIPRPHGSRLGEPAPWAGLAEVDRIVDLEHVRTALAAGPPPDPSRVERLGARPSSVLAPLYERDGGVNVVLTRRAWHMRSHTGEVSFPGGRREPHDENLLATALREAHEEIALDPASVEIIGELDHLATVTSRSFIVPYVGVIDGPERLEPDPGEVDAVLHVPLAELLLDEVYREERWGFQGLDRPIWFFELAGDTVWGATAAMLRDLLQRIVAHR